MAPTLESIHEDGLLHILQYASPAASARLGLASREWSERILCGGGENAGGLSRRLWRSFAVERWGRGVSTDCNDDDNGADGTTWCQYYRHRCSSGKLPAEHSPIDLIQEYYAEDPYRLLTSCILCSRTSGGPVIRQVVGDFLKKYPTPTDVVDAELSAMRDELHPLGLNRERTMLRFAAGFLGEWTDVTELHGCGAFAASSFDVFCRGDYKKVLKDKKVDRNVKAYASYLKRVREGGGIESPRDVQQAKAKHSGKSKKRSRQSRNGVPARRMRRNRKAKGGS